MKYLSVLQQVQHSGWNGVWSNSNPNMAMQRQDTTYVQCTLATHNQSFHCVALDVCKWGSAQRVNFVFCYVCWDRKAVNVHQMHSIPEPQRFQTRFEHTQSLSTAPNPQQCAFVGTASAAPRKRNLLGCMNTVEAHWPL